MKEGSYKYLLQLLHAINREIRELRRTQRYLIQGLEHTFLFDDDYITTIACKDEIDREILDVLYMAGPPGKLPRDVAAELADYKINPWNVTQRIRRMNKRLDQHIAREVAEKRGLKWALTNWAYSNWDSTEEEMEDA
ncbi:MAG: hypothetical protein OEZ29_04470 [Candidatus Bathyarchaeota archaeon]|nr:hypothetical protein [Candidatus Bathyarchaeota archaeon]